MQSDKKNILKSVEKCIYETFLLKKMANYLVTVFFISLYFCFVQSPSTLILKEYVFNIL